MSGRTIEVGMRIDGNAKGAQDAVGALRSDLVSLRRDGDNVKLLEGESFKAKELAAELGRVQGEILALAEASQRVKVLETAIDSVDRYKIEVTKANSEVSKIQSTLNEAFNAGADKSLISALEKQLTGAERAANRANKAFEASQAAVVRLNLEASKTGISTSNLAEKKLELAAATQKLTGEFEALKAGMASLEAIEQRAANSTRTLNAAFDSLGIRSAKQIDQDIQQVNRSLLALATRAGLSGEEFDRAFSAGQAKIGRLRAELKGMPDDIDHVANKTDNLTGMMSRLGLVFGGLELAREFVKANVALENMERTFRAVTGSTNRAAEEMAYAHDVANRLGLPIITAGKAYADLMASTKGTAVEGLATRAVFESVARAMSVAGKSSADTEGALLALSQMASKGVISMEELRGQLGERLPGALNAVASGFGITTAQLIKLVESGTLTSEELFPALTAGLNKLYEATGKSGEQADTASQAWARLQNTVTDTFKFIADTGVWTAIVAILGQVAIVVRGLTGAFALLGKIIGITSAAMHSFDFRHPIESIKTYTRAVIEAAAEIQKEMDKANRKTDESGDGQKKLAEATKEAAEAASTASQSWTKINVRFNELESSTAGATKQAQLHAEAIKAETEAALGAAQAFGTEEQKLNAKEEATRKNSEALSALAKARGAELAAIRDHIQSLESEANAHDGGSDSQKKVISELKKTAEARQEDANKADSQAAAARNVADQAEFEAKAHADNSGRVMELKGAYDQATAAAERIRAGKSDVYNVTEALAEADRKAAIAGALYRDALHDQTAAIARNAAEKQSQISVDQAGIRLAIEQQRTIYEVSKARGDEYGATQALLEIKRLEIKLAELTAKAKEAEAEASLLIAKAKREELKAAGQLTAAKEAELKAQEAGAQVKKVEAQISSELAERMRLLAEQTEQSANGANKAASDYDRLSESLDGVGNSAKDARDKLSAMDNLPRRNSGQGGGGGDRYAENRDASGTYHSPSSTNSVDFLAEALRNGVPKEQAQAVAEEASRVFSDNMKHGNTSKMIGNFSVGNWQNDVDHALEKAMQNSWKIGGASTDTSKNGTTTDKPNESPSFSDVVSQKNELMQRHREDNQQAQAPQRSAPQQKTIRIVLQAPGNKKTDLYADDQGAVDSFLRILEQAGITANKSRGW